jgi:hypothetical protein
MFIFNFHVHARRITLGQHKSDNNNRMIQLTDVFYVQLSNKYASSFRLQ